MKRFAWLKEPAVRQATQSAVAVALAIAVGSALSGRRWYWAVIAAFIVALGVGSRGEATVKGLQRLIGTLFGVGVGVGLATAVSGHAYLTYALVLVSSFFAYYAFQAAYGAMVFFITLMLSLLYGLLGQFKPELLLLRLEETAAGAAVGVAAVYFILPTPQGEAFGQALDAYLDALARALAPPEEQDDRARAIDELREKTLQMRNAHGAVKRGWAGLAHVSYRDTIRAAMHCTFLTREWLLGEAPWEPAGETRRLAERIVRRIADMKARKPARPAREGAMEMDTLALERLEALDQEVARMGGSVATLRRSP